MKKRVILFIVVCLSCVYLYAQKISNIDFKQLGNNIIVSYSLTGLKSSQVANVSLYVSTDGGQTFTGPLQEVDGDVGENVKAGEQKLIQWEALKEIPEFGGNIVFDVRASIMDKKQARMEKEKKEKEKKERPPKEKKEKAEEEKKKKPLPRPSNLVLFAGINGSNHAPVGIAAIGKMGKFGGYVSGRLNPQYFTKTSSYEFDPESNSILNYGTDGFYRLSGSDDYKRLSVTGGIIFMPVKFIGCYIGGGFAEYDLLWKVQEYSYPRILNGTDYAFHKGESFSSFEVEAGLSANFWKIYLGVGVSSPQMQWFEGTATLGYKIF